MPRPDEPPSIWSSINVRDFAPPIDMTTAVSRCPNCGDSRHVARRPNRDWWCGNCRYQWQDQVPTEQTRAQFAEAERRRAETAAAIEADTLRSMRASPARIYNYTFKPPPVFKGQSSIGLYYGLENEVEVPEEIRLTTFTGSIARVAQPGLLYFKQDGTIHNGVEMVTHPMSFNYFDRKFPEAVMNILQRDGRNWAGRPREYTCGLHVHMSKAAFGPIAKEYWNKDKRAWVEARGERRPAHHLFKFVQFIYNNPAFVQFVAGREGAVLRGAEMCSYNKRLLGSQEAFDHKLKDWVLSNDAQVRAIAKGAANHPDRHMAVNLQNKATVEMRMFRGTTNFKRMRAAVQFCDALFYYTKTHYYHHRDPEKQMSEAGFRAFAATRPVRYADLLRVLANDPEWAC